MNTQKALIKLENENFEYVLSEDSLIPNEDVVQVGDEYQSVVYADGSKTVLLQGNEYYIQTGDGQTFMLENDQESIDQLIINNDEQSEECIEYIQAEDDTEDSIVYEIGSKRLKLDNGQYITLTDSDTVDLARAEELSILNSVNGGDSSIQYAVLKDGQLHLQLAEDDTVEILNSTDGQLTDNTDSNVSVLQVYSEEEGEPEQDVDFSKITGRNVLTGKTVNLNDYINRITKTTKKDDERTEKSTGPKTNQFVNQKFQIGKVPSGKFLVGKILNIQPPKQKVATVEEKMAEIHEEQVTENTNGSEPVTDTVTEVEELIFEDSETVLNTPTSSDGEPTEEQISHLTKILNGLADMESLHKKLLGKKLQVKLVEKHVDSNGRNGEKCVMFINGFLGDNASEVLNGQAERSEYVFNVLKGAHDYEIVECVEETGEVIIKQSLEGNATTALTVLVTTDSNDHKTTRVTFADTPPQPNYCSLCSMHFKTTVQLNRHNSTWHTERNLTCNVCNNKFSDYAKLTKHREQHDHYFTCPFCEKRFTVRSSLKRHMATVHEMSKRNENSAILPAGADLTCTSCDKTFDCVIDFHCHQSLHAAKLFYCETCGREFSRHSNLLRHAEIHQGDVHKCNICGCSYKYISSLTRHIVQNHVEKV